jgi:hypothetical protein
MDRRRRMQRIFSLSIHWQQKKKQGQEREDKNVISVFFPQT